FVRGVAGMCHYITRDYDDALRLYEEGLAMDPNSVICLWQSGMTLDRLGRLNEELERFTRAVDLSSRGALMVSFRYRALHKLGRVAEANAVLDNIRARANRIHRGEFLARTCAVERGRGPDRSRTSSQHRCRDRPDNTLHLGGPGTGRVVTASTPGAIGATTVAVYAD